MVSGSEHPRVTHFNDCAFVGRALVGAAARAGLTWKYVGPEAVRPAAGFRGGSHLPGELPYILRHERVALTSDVVHVHYATSVPLLQKPYIPKRPYVLHLHGTDIRRQWKAPETHDLIQRAIDGASAVYYPNLDTAEAATTARPDAVHMPIIVDTGILPAWRPSSESGSPTVLFVSRWDDSKGVENQLAVAHALRAALPQDARLLGLDWGPGAPAAAEAGVELVPRRSHDRFLDLIAGADVAVAQSSGVLATSELEAMAIGPAVLVPVPSIADDGDPAPVLTGTVDEVVEQTMDVLRDPRAASVALGGRAWVEKKHTGDRWVAELERVYRAAATR
ncbi:hypothetical protein [Leifsonia poae]|uniref:D-inositol 3-phosphate glycosyltransferase n=1 Tax=Leifsonia poae TaxID=110933 RepID=A0A9W6LYV2_9MICO|nr:hypothetical protein [Leifsonia poae]GLJ75240.1 hypothetical protein GCM10017584_08140 [Leifsonia poae]